MIELCAVNWLCAIRQIIGYRQRVIERILELVVVHRFISNDCSSGCL